jgi:hypothetical protein
MIGLHNMMCCVAREKAAKRKSVHASLSPMSKTAPCMTWPLQRDCTYCTSVIAAGRARRGTACSARCRVGVLHDQDCLEPSGQLGQGLRRCSRRPCAAGRGVAAINAQSFFLHVDAAKQDLDELVTGGACAPLACGGGAGVSGRSSSSAEAILKSCSRVI